MAQTPHVLDVGTENFETEVVERSKTVPVLVDFWAPWCGPCRVLGPILESVADQLGGAVVVAKVNSDENQELAASFRVQGIPFVVLMRGGKAVDRFVGVRREAEVLDFLRPHLPSPADESLSAAAEHLATGTLDAAEESYRLALEADPRSHPARLGLARCLLGRFARGGAEGDLDALRETIQPIPARAAEYEPAEKLLELGKMTETLDESDQRTATFRTAVAELAVGVAQEGLERLLSIAAEDRRWNDEAARKAMVAAFHLVGVRDPLSDAYRDKLRAIYY